MELEHTTIIYQQSASFFTDKISHILTDILHFGKSEPNYIEDIYLVQCYQDAWKNMATQK